MKTDEVKRLIAKNKKEHAERTKREADFILVICKDIDAGAHLLIPATYTEMYGISEDRTEHLIREILKIKKVKFLENAPYFGYRKNREFEIVKEQK